MSSHREAPEVSKDPVTDNTDVYAFVSPDKPGTITLIANFIPFQNPQGGPNFYEFGDDVLYEIHVSNRGDAMSDVTYQFRFTTRIRNKDTFLYNTGSVMEPIGPVLYRKVSLLRIRVVNLNCHVRRDLPVQVHHPDPQQGHLPVQHRADRLHHRPELEPAAVLLGDPGRPGRPAADP